MGSYIYGGDHVTIQNSTQDYQLRQPLNLNNLQGVTATKTKKGQAFTLITRGVFEFKKAVPSEVLEVGKPAFFKVVNGDFVFTGVEKDANRFGVFVAKSPANDSSPVRVLIQPYYF